jgi:hypothetical protein
LADGETDHDRGAGPPGPAVDFIARLVAEKLRQSLGQAVVVENRGGASGSIASTMVARAAPDGYTLMAATSGTHVSPVHLMKNLTYDPIKDFTPIMAAAEPVTGLVINAALPVKSVPELIAYAKANPGKLTYGSSGVGSVFHVMGELLNQTAGIETRHVPYRAPMQDVIAGHPDDVRLGVERGGRPAGRQGQAARRARSQTLREASGCAVDERVPSDVSKAAHLVRILRPGEHAAGDRRTAQ